ncbi:MAG: ATP-binding cassette domain-containing protein [Acidobacteria bacterium]|nr:ATP-binding cassette domain-containing protein [Acidobacteriota bacterium]
MDTPTDVILEVKDLTVRFPVTGGVFLRRLGEVRAVDHVSFTIGRGETLGLVGESGCGKTTVGRAVVNILAAMAYGVEVSGEILYHTDTGVVDLAKLSRAAMRPYRSDIQMVFQDPYASLNPRKTVTQIIAEPLRIHGVGGRHGTSQSSGNGSASGVGSGFSRTSGSEIGDRVAWLLQKVGLSAEQGNRYPHEFSGGQRQRIGIARALATNPKLVIADEPVSALDVSVQAQVINLMQDLQEEFGLSYLFIAHDLSVVRHISNRIAVMYLGHIVEMGDAETIYQTPLHPYSRALLASAPRPDPNARRIRQAKLAGDLPSPMNKPSGCPFRTRCPIARESCADAVPPLEFREGRWVACPYAE